MLTAETKRKIDYLRDALVGKIPVPSDQIDQITLGLIYKFMSDIDEQNEELGGKSFFSGEYKKYAWKNIIDRSLAGHERVLFYAEGLEKMSRNRELPQLFRDIFKGAFLPFKDPAVLDLFLKGINEFKYENSEDLGNAFEYLLSTAASQGDAGMFRTPRHIIDFIVEVVDPQKEDKILDPACGTAGFLVSAYKHILEDNTDKKSDRAGSLLTATERKKLTKNIVGYDISHQMVRLSLVNLYLHGFAEPNIYEYDTLSSLERWDDNFDCLLANPPFMTPRGGIMPHNRFPIQAKRSEVLFVDYITEHLTPSGKAGIIVPEGIIFKNDGAYKQLRKMLVEDGLWAVVSLPQGVFNPYAGVKTSILFFNNAIAKQTKEILFVKVENDGFDLGAQRRPIDKNDLPTRLELLKKYKKAVQENKKFNLSKDEEKFASVVKKEKIAENGDYNLAADHYLVSIDYTNAKWPMVALGEIASIGAGNSAPQEKDLFKNGQYRFFRTSDVGIVHISDNLMSSRDKLNEKGTKGLKLFPKNTILFPKSGASTFLNHRAMLGIEGYVSSHLATIIPNENKILPIFLFNLLKEIDAKSLTNDQNYPSLKTSEIAKIKIPLPPIEIQKEIVTELNSYQKIIDGAKQIIDNYKPTIKIDSGWPRIELGNLFLETKLGLVKDKSKQSPNFPNPYIKMENITIDGNLDISNIVGVEATEAELANYTLNDGDFIYNTRNAPNLVGKSSVYRGESGKYLFNNNILRIRFNKNANSDYINLYLNTPDGKEKIKRLVSGTTSVAAIYQRNFATITIPLPPIKEQEKIVKIIEMEKESIKATINVISIFELKIKEKISDIW
jgi:type I restriction enzyme M protein